MNMDKQNNVRRFFQKSADPASQFTKGLKYLLERIEEYMKTYPEIVDLLNNAKIKDGTPEDKERRLDLRSLAIEDLQNAIALALHTYVSDNGEVGLPNERAIDIYHELNRYKQHAEDSTKSWDESKKELFDKILDIRTSSGSGQTVPIGQCMAILANFSRNFDQAQPALMDSAYVLEAHQWTLASLASLLDDPRTISFKKSLGESMFTLGTFFADMQNRIQEDITHAQGQDIEYLDPEELAEDMDPEGLTKPERAMEEALKSDQNNTSREMTSTRNRNTQGSSQSGSKAQNQAPLELEKLIEQYGENLTVQAQDEGKQNISGREDIVHEMVISLSRKDAPNVILSGEKGIGKSEILHSLAVALGSGEGPERLKSANIIELDLARMGALTGSGQRQGLADEGYMLTEMLRYNFTEILQQMSEKNVSGLHYILKLNGRDFIGTSEKINNLGAILLSEIEKEGSVPIIFEVSSKDFSKVQNQNPALIEKFDIVRAKEPEASEVLKLVSEKAQEIEKLHGGVHTSREMLERLVQLTNEHKKDLAQPGWALSILDGAAARSEAEGASAIQEDHVIRQLAKKINLPEYFVGTQISERIASLRNYLPTVIFGQDEAINTVAGHLESYELRDANKPLGVICLVGPTGVGKTELSIQTAKHLYDSEEIHGPDQSLIRVDMNNYSDKVSASRITGASPNYIGYGEPTALEAINERPNSVVLLDEFEKAHPDVQKTLMNVFDTGHLTLHNGKSLDFTNAVFILTSNLGAAEAEEASKKRQIGFVEQENSEEKASEAARKEREKKMLPEIRNRIVFAEMTKLGDKDARKVTMMKVSKVGQRLRKRYPNIALKVDKPAIDLIHQSYNSQYGGRSVDRAVQEKLAAPLGQWMLGRENKQALLNAPEGSVLRIRSLKKNFNPKLEKPESPKNVVSSSSHPEP